jgi:protein ImuA
MSQGGRSERLDFLRRKIARIETSGLEADARLGLRARVNLGENLSLDRMLHGGLCRGALHEIVPGRAGDDAAASGFALALSARFAAKAAEGRSSIIWIVEDYARLENGAPYGPGLALHGVDPARLVLVHALNAKESLWSMEEALKCRAAAAVIAEIWGLEKAYGLAASRRLALAAQKSGTPGLMLAAGMARGADRLSTSAQTRFEIRSRPGPCPPAARGLPLPGLASWSIRVVKARAGPDRFNFDRDKILSILWDHEEACFRDALSLPLSSHARNRSDHPDAARARRAIVA